MGQGLQLWDEYGNITLDTDNRLPRGFGELYLNQRVDGAISVPDFNQGQPWFYTMIDWANVFESNDVKTYSDHNFAIAEIAGTTLKWHWGPRNDGKGYYHPTWIVYGAY